MFPQVGQRQITYEQHLHLESDILHRRQRVTLEQRILSKSPHPAPNIISIGWNEIFQSASAVRILYEGSNRPLKSDMMGSLLVKLENLRSWWGSGRELRGTPRRTTHLSTHTWTVQATKIHVVPVLHTLHFKQRVPISMRSLHCTSLAAILHPALQADADILSYLTHTAYGNPRVCTYAFRDGALRIPRTFQYSTAPSCTVWYGQEQHHSVAFCYRFVSLSGYKSKILGASLFRSVHLLLCTNEVEWRSREWRFSRAFVHRWTDHAMSSP